MREIKAHTGLRGIAALAVFLVHANFDQLWPQASWFIFIYSFFRWANPAVDLFFMLSGFILNYVYLKNGSMNRPMDWRKYFSARFARICPLYYATLCFPLATNLASMHFGHSLSDAFAPGELLPNLAMMQEWPFFGFIQSINHPSWSVSVEVFLYLFLLPPLVIIYSRFPVPKSLSLGLLLLLLIVDSSICREIPHFLDFPYSGLVRGIAGFGSGFLICELIHDRSDSAIPGWAETIVAILFLGILPLKAIHFLLPPAFVCIIAITYLPNSRLGKVLGSPVFAYLGAISYSIYLWQYPVFRVSSLLFGLRELAGYKQNAIISEPQKFLYFGGTVLILLALSTLSYYCFEIPMRSLLRRPIREWFRWKSFPWVREGNPGVG